MKTIRRLALLFVIVVAFATILAFTQDQIKTTMPWPNHELQKSPTEPAVTPENKSSTTTSSGGKLLAHVHTPPGIYGLPVSGEWTSPWASPTSVYCPQKRWIETTVVISFANVPANNTLGANVVVVDSKGNRLPILPFNTVGMYSSTVYQGSGTSTGSFTFHTNPLPAGWYYVTGEFGLASQPGSAGSPSQEILITAYTPLTQ
jgi:hypothetical protein